MKKLKGVGFFRELRHGFPNGPSLKSVRSETPQPDEERIVGYVSTGELFIASPGMTTDVLAARRVPIASGSVMTDGEWAWPDDLPYYIATYHAAVPGEFVEHMRNNAWKVPLVDRATLATLALGES